MNTKTSMITICLISVEIFAWGKHGGFGKATRLIGGELVKRGYKVFAVVPRRPGQNKKEILDGIEVLSFSPFNPFEAAGLFKQTNADIFHSCEPSFGTYLAKKTMPDRKHMVTFRDPRNTRDWIMEFVLPSLNHLQVIHNYIYEHNYLVNSAIRKMDRVFTIGKYLVPKVKRMYHLKKDPEFLPTPVKVPPIIEKKQKPTVCYVARLDRRKRPELFLDLANHFPDVEFLVVGKSRNKEYEKKLIKKYGNLSNLNFLGFVDQFASNTLSKVLSNSWISINCATREALPNSFLESAAHGCAILSSVNPDNFASEFGYHVKDNNFVSGLAYLLKKDRWKAGGEKAREFIKNQFSLPRAMDLHEKIYNELILE